MTHAKRKSNHKPGSNYFEQQLIIYFKHLPAYIFSRCTKYKYIHIMLLQSN